MPAPQREILHAHPSAPSLSPPKRQTVKVVVPLADKLLLTVEEFAAMIGVGRSTAWGLVYSGQVRAVTIGRLRRITRQAAEEYVNGLPAA